MVKRGTTPNERNHAVERSICVCPSSHVLWFEAPEQISFPHLSSTPGNFAMGSDKSPVTVFRLSSAHAGRVPPIRRDLASGT
jgi:hypothetical protein